jgi:hypothetical protein
MQFQITRDADGNVTITDLATGRTETRPTAATGRPAERSISAAQDIPAHMWSRLA